MFGSTFVPLLSIPDELPGGVGIVDRIRSASIVDCDPNISPYCWCSVNFWNCLAIRSLRFCFATESVAASSKFVSLQTPELFLFELARILYCSPMDATAPLMLLLFPSVYLSIIFERSALVSTSRTSRPDTDSSNVTP